LDEANGCRASRRSRTDNDDVGVHEWIKFAQGASRSRLVQSLLAT
jgi:hypothetical protein